MTTSADAGRARHRRTALREDPRVAPSTQPKPFAGRTR